MTEGAYTAKYLLECAEEKRAVIEHANAMAEAIRAYKKSIRGGTTPEYRELIRVWEEYRRHIQNHPIVETSNEWKSS